MGFIANGHVKSIPFKEIINGKSEASQVYGDSYCNALDRTILSNPFLFSLTQSSRKGRQFKVEERDANQLSFLKMVKILVLSAIFNQRNANSQQK